MIDAMTGFYTSGTRATRRGPILRPSASIEKEAHMTSPTARAHTKRRLAACAALPDDIKADIAASARSLNMTNGRVGGMCFWRTLVGYYALSLLRIETRISLGGLVYRVGPDERRDVIAFCGPGNVGIATDIGIRAHYFLTTGGGEIVDFSVGDWKRDDERWRVIVKDYGDDSYLGPIQWAIDPPAFHWDDANKFRRPAGSTLYTPELGQAWYTGFRGDRSGVFEAIKEDMDTYRDLITGVLAAQFEARDLIERVRQAISPVA